MYSTVLALALAFFFLQLALIADAGIFVVKPEAHSICHGGQECTIQWFDDGIRPLLDSAGVCTFGLYTGTLQLVQAIPPVDVSATLSISFKPIPAAGPSSDTYYIGIISTTAKENSSDPFSGSYMAFSPFFSLDKMTGSFDSPLPEATSTIPIPSSLAHSGTAPTTQLSTITIGTLSTSLPPLPTVTSTSPTTSAPSQTRLVTSTSSLLMSNLIITTSSVASLASSAPQATTSPNGTIGRVIPTLGLTTVGLLFSSILVFLF